MADARGLSAAVFQTEPIRDFSKDVAMGMQVKAAKRKLKKEEVEAFDEKYGITHPEGVSSSFMPIMNKGVDQYKSARNEYIQAKEAKSPNAPVLKQKLESAKENLNKLTEVAKAGQVNSERVYKLSQDQKDSLSREKLQEYNEYIERMNTPEGEVDLLNGTINGKPMSEFVNPPAFSVNKTETNPYESVYTKTIDINKDIYTIKDPDTGAETFNELKAQQIAADRLTNRSPEGVDMVVDYLAKDNTKTRDEVTQTEIDVAFKNEDTMKAIQDDYVDYARMMTSEKVGKTKQEGGTTVTRENIGREAKALGNPMTKKEVYGPFLGNDKEKIPGPFSENDVVKNNVIIGMVPTKDIIINRNSTIKKGEGKKVNEALDHKVLDIKYNKTKGEYYAKLVTNEKSEKDGVFKTQYPNDKLTETQVLSIENQMGLSPEVELKDVIESSYGDEQPTNIPETESNTESPDRKQNKEIITKVAKEKGENADYFIRLAELESSLGTNEDDTTDATGIFQFQEKTGKQYDLSSEDRNDVTKSTEAVIEFTKDNKKSLKKTLGKEPENWQLYLAHQQGAGGFKELHKNPNKKAIEIVGEDAVIQNGGSKDMTSKEFMELWKEKYQGKAPKEENAKENKDTEEEINLSEEEVDETISKYF